ncbi:MAG: hypothetical protein COA42_23965 [Alteromonadaceae bacterium]|nr:MAG: hypothetical protein COA42_23965 [Alteromonadaceae bacterium]
MQVKSPFYTLIIPTKDRPDMLDRALKSAVSQGFSSLEIIVINDGSAMSYEAVENSHKGHVTFLHNLESQGVSAARNRGIKEAQGEWLIFLDDDDKFSCDYFEILKTYITDAPEVDFFWCDIEVVLERLGAVVGRHLRVFRGDYSRPEVLYRDAMSIGAGFGLAVNASVFSEVGGFDESFLYGEDTELMTRFAARGLTPKQIPHTGVLKYEEHEGRLAASLKPYSENGIYERIIEMHMEFFDRDQYNKSYLLRWAAISHLRSGNLKNSWISLQGVRRTGRVGFYWSVKWRLIRIWFILTKASFKRKIRAS